MEWSRLLSTKRERAGGNFAKAGDLRSEFEKDYHRIIGSASFRRLQDKTQVFPLDKSDFVRTRLTHSLEVSSLGKSLGQTIGENILEHRKNSGFTPQMKEDISHILECAGLIHDIGNPPFGHFGEIAIREWFERNLPKLTFCQKIKYPGSSLQIDENSGNIKDRKMGYYFADEEIFHKVTKETGAGRNRHPLTYMLEAADDLAYKTADIEDSFVKGFIRYADLERELKELEEKKRNGTFRPAYRLRQLYERGIQKRVHDPESYAVKNWIVNAQGFLLNCATEGFMANYDAIMSGKFGQDLFYGTNGEELMELLGDMADRYVFSSMAIYKMEVSESAVIDYLMERLVQAALYFDTKEKQGTIDRRVISFISDNYKNAYRIQSEGKSEAEKLYLRLLLVTDYVCGMTDSYAKRLYQEMNGII